MFYQVFFVFFSFFTAHACFQNLTKGTASNLSEKDPYRMALCINDDLKMTKGKAMAQVIPTKFDYFVHFDCFHCNTKIYFVDSVLMQLLVPTNRISQVENLFLKRGRGKENIFPFSKLPMQVL